MEPHQQGDLDSCCGLYAIINAFLIAAKHIHKFSLPECENLYHVLMEELDKKYYGKSKEGFGAAGTIKEGMTSNVISFLLKKPMSELLAKKDVKLIYSKPFHKQSNPKRNAFLKKIQEHLRQPGNSAIIHITNEDYNTGHWTVPQSCTLKRIILADSTKLRHITIKRMHIGKKIYEKDWTISAPLTFFLAVSKL